MITFNAPGLAQTAQTAQTAQNRLQPLLLSFAADAACDAVVENLFSRLSSWRRLSILSSTSSSISLRRMTSKCLRTFGSSLANRSMSASERRRPSRVSSSRGN